MKTILLFVMLVIASGSFAQGIVFENGTWQEVLKKAHELNKPVFVDVYTTWCGPCKLMAKEIFPLKETGDFYNEHFICYKLDAEKGEGIEISENFGVYSYPSYVFTNVDGKLIYRSGSYMTKEEFIQIGRAALKEMDNPLSYPIIESRYLENRNDLIAMLNYLKKRHQFNMLNDKLLDEYLRKLTPAQQIADSTLQLLCNDNNSIYYGSLAFRTLTENKEKISSLDVSYADRFDYIIRNVIYQLINRGVRNKQDSIVGKAAGLTEYLLGEKYQLFSEQVWMDYYDRTGQQDKYLSEATKFLESRLLIYSEEELKKMNSAHYLLWEESLKPGDTLRLTPAQITSWKNYNRMFFSNRFAMDINEICWNIFLNFLDENTLRKALSWSRHSLLLSREEEGAYIDTYANLLHKLGETPEAILWQTKALEIITSKGEDAEEYEATLSKMKRGEPTWKDKNE